jgi:3-methylfumaryl-CoA hydratase
MMSDIAAADLDIAHLSSWIGRETAATELLTAELVEKFNATLDIASPETAPGAPAPRLIHLCLTQPAALASALGPDGHPARGGFLPPVPLPRRMWAAGAFTFHGDLAVGDRVRRTSRIADVQVKHGRTGALCFVEVDHAIDVEGRIVLAERQTIVYRGVDQGTPGKPAEPAPVGTHVRTVDPSPTLMFRYSALTFNGHRIHYDHPYATKVEGYPGLVFHGPLQATLLYNLAAEIRGTPPARFTFRSLSPLFDNAPVLLNAVEEGDGLKLWTCRRGGPIAMTAEATWS